MLILWSVVVVIISVLHHQLTAVSDYSPVGRHIPAISYSLVEWRDFNGIYQLIIAILFSSVLSIIFIFITL